MNKLHWVGPRVALLAMVIAPFANLVNPMTASITGAVPVGPDISAAKTALDTTTNTTGPAAPGDTIQYTVTISNAAGATAAAGVSFTDTVDANTTVNTNSLDVTPIAQDDSYSVLGNVPITVSLPANGLLANDEDPDGDTVTLSDTGTHSTANSGSIALNGDGTFTYTPPTGFTGTDTFTYTISDGHSHTDSATVTFNVSGMIWFIDNSQGTNGDGSLNSPFNNLASFQAINDAGTNHGKTGQTIFVYSGNGNYAGNLTLLNGQKLIGQGAGSSLITYSGFTLPTYSASLPGTGGTNPTLTGDITLGQNNVIQGLDVSASTGTAISGSAGGNFTIGDASGNVHVSNSAGGAFNLSGYTLSAVLASVTSSGAASGIALSNNTGSFKASTITISNSSGTGLSDTSSGSFGTLEIDAGTITSTSGAQAINVSHGSAAITLTKVSDDGANTQTNGIVLDNISAGNFTISGSCSTNDGSSGIIQNMKGRGASFTSINSSSHISLSCMDFTNDGTTIAASCVDDPLNGTPASCNGAIYFNSASNVTLNRIVVDGSSNATQEGIVGNAVNNFALTNSEVRFAGLSACSGGCIGTPPAYSGVEMMNLTGTVTITGVNLHDNGHNNLDIENNTGTLNATISGTFGKTGNGSTTTTNAGDDGIKLVGESTGTSTSNFATIFASIEDSTISNAKIAGVRVNAMGTSKMDVTVGASGHANTFSGITGPDINVNGYDQAVVHASIDHNTMSGSQASAIAVEKNKTGQSGFTLAGTVIASVTNNTVGTVGVNSSGGSNDIDASGSGVGTFTVLIDSNKVYGVSGNDGIKSYETDTAGGQLTTNLTITNNTVNIGTGTGTTPFAGIDFENGTINTDDVVTCADIKSNTISDYSSVGVQSIFALSHFGLGSTGLAGHSAGFADATAVESYLDGRNTITNGTTTGSANTAVAEADSPFIDGPATCTQPTAPTLPHLLRSNRPHTLGLTAGHTASGAGIAAGHNPIALTRISRGAAIFGAGLTRSAIVGILASRYGPLRPRDDTLTSSTVTVNNFTLPGGHSVTIVYTVTVNDDISAGSITNDAAVTWTGNVTPIIAGPAITTVSIPTSADLTSSLNPASVGQLITFTDTITNTGGTATPTGTVQFKDGGTNLGSAVTLSGSGDTATATVSTSSLSIGSHTITADYTPASGTGFAAQTGTQLDGGPQVVTGPDLTLVKADGVNKSTTFNTGWSWTLTAANTGDADATFSQNAVILQDDLPSTGLSYGTPTVGSESAITGGGTIQCSIDGGQTLTCTANGGSVTIGATTGTFVVTLPVTPTAAATYANPRNGGTCAIDPNNAITEGDETNNACSDTVTVNQAGSSVAVTSTENPSKVGDSVTFTATVSNTDTSAVPDGNVTFTADKGTGSASVLCSSVTLASGVATCTTSNLPAGTHSITADYSGSTNFTGSSGTLSGGQEVDKHASSVTTTSDQNPSLSGHSVRFTASVSAADGDSVAPTGSVTFTADKGTANAVTMCSNVALGSGAAPDATSAVCDYSSLSVGSHVITADYNGDGTYLPSTDSSLTQRVVDQPAGTGTVSPSDVRPSHDVTFSVTITQGQDFLGNVTGDMTQIGGSSSVSFTKDNNDPNLWTAIVTVGGGVADGTYILPITLHGTQGATDGSVSISLQVDGHAPLVNNLTATPAASNSTAPTITGSIDDSTTGNSVITAAQYTVTDSQSTVVAGPTDITVPGTNVTQPVSFSIPAAVYSGLADGTYTVTVQGTDAAGNTGSNTVNFTVDRQPPTVDITGPSGYTNGKSPSWSFTVSDPSPSSGGLQYRYKLDGPGNTTGSFSSFASYSGSGSVTVPYSNLTDGTYTFTVQATDAAGNVVSSSTTIYLDTAQPSVSITTHPANPTNSTSASFTFQALATPPDALAPANTVAVLCKLDTPAGPGTYGPCTTSNSMSYSGLNTNGSYTFTVQAMDLAGNTNTASFTWTVDTVPPTVDLTGPSGYSNSSSFAWSFTVSDVTPNGNGVSYPQYRYKLDGPGSTTGSFSSWTTYTGKVSVPAYTLSVDGTYTFTVQVQDAAGNVTTTSDTIYRETTPPSVTINGKPSNPTNSTTASFTFQTSATTPDALAPPNTVSVQCKLDTPSGPGTYGACTSSTTMDFTGLTTNGSYTFTVQATDLAGNTNTASFTWTVDTVPPTVTITGPSGLIGSTSPTWTFTLSDPSPSSGGLQYRYKLDGPGNTTGTYSAWQAYTGQVTASYSGLAFGSYTFTVQAEDAAGNVTTKSVSIQIGPNLTVSISLPAPYTSAATSHIFLSGTLLGTVSPGHPLVTAVPFGTALTLTADQVLLATTASPTTFFFTGFSPPLSGGITSNTSTIAVYTSMEVQLKQGYPIQFLGTNAVKLSTYNKLVGDWQTAERTIEQPVGASSTKRAAVKTFACDAAAAQITSSFNSKLQTYAGQAYIALGGTFTGSVCATGHAALAVVRTSLHSATAQPLPHWLAALVRRDYQRFAGGR